MGRSRDVDGGTRESRDGVGVVSKREKSTIHPTYPREQVAPTRRRHRLNQRREDISALSAGRRRQRASWCVSVESGAWLGLLCLTHPRAKPSVPLKPHTACDRWQPRSRWTARSMGSVTVHTQCAAPCARPPRPRWGLGRTPLHHQPSSWAGCGFMGVLAAANRRRRCCRWRRDVDASAACTHYTGQREPDGEARDHLLPCFERLAFGDWYNHARNICGGAREFRGRCAAALSRSGVCVASPVHCCGLHHVDAAALMVLR